MQNKQATLTVVSGDSSAWNGSLYRLCFKPDQDPQAAGCGGPAWLQVVEHFSPVNAMVSNRFTTRWQQRPLIDMHQWN